MSEEKLYAVKNGKGEWYDWSDMEFWPKEACTFVTVGNQEDAEHVADSAAGGHVVTLIEEQKVKLPREVGEELDQFAARYVDVLQFVYHLYALSATEFPALVNWMCSAERRWVIIDAYRYGWDAEPEAKWYVKTPKEWWEDSAILEWMHFDTCRGVCSGFSKLGRTAFTRAELKQYNLDSDIFTLVPVEEEK